MFKFPNEQLPQKGERVVTIVVKEMIYQGNSHDNGSDWIDDGQGFRAIMSWTPLSNLNQIIIENSK